MISLLHGKIVAKNMTSVVIDCAGIGFKVNVPFSVAQVLVIDASANLFIQPVFSRDGLELFGFLKNEQKKTFNLLLKVRGVGARAALNILSQLSPDEIQNAIVTSKTHIFQSIPGIGKKKAEMIIFHLSKSLKDDKVMPEVHHQALETLVALGLSRKEAFQKLAKIPNVNAKSLSEIIQLVLQSDNK